MSELDKTRDEKQAVPDEGAIKPEHKEEVTTEEENRLRSTLLR